MTARELMADINAVKSDGPQIINPETIRRWLRDGCPGLKREG
ncbi:MAG: hypothetical protein AAFR84_00885 [Pseudomonadota bacterium]